MAKETAATIATCTLTNPQTIILTVPKGHDAEQLRSKVAAYYATLLSNEENIEQQFNTHYHKWMTETMFLSSTPRIINHPDFRAIVEMGKDAVPFIIQSLKQKPSFLYKALEMIYKTRLLPAKTENIDGVTWIMDKPLENCKLWIQKLK